MNVNVTDKPINMKKVKNRLSIKTPVNGSMSITVWIRLIQSHFNELNKYVWYIWQITITKSYHFHCAQTYWCLSHKGTFVPKCFVYNLISSRILMWLLIAVDVASIVDALIINQMENLLWNESRVTKVSSNFWPSFSTFT